MVANQPVPRPARLDEGTAGQRKTLYKTSAVAGTAEATPLQGGIQNSSKQGLSPTAGARRRFLSSFRHPPKAKTPPGERGFLNETAVGSRGDWGTAVYSPE
jgi:hypothetical protein